MAKVTYVHFGVAESEIGIQFTVADGAGGTVDGRAFASADPTLKQAVLDAAQAALGALTGTLPVDMPPGEITTVLMKRRNALQEADKATARRLAAEADTESAIARRAAAEDARMQIESERENATFEYGRMVRQTQAAIMQKQAIEAAIAAKKAELAQLDAAIGAAKEA